MTTSTHHDGRRLPAARLARGRRGPVLLGALDHADDRGAGVARLRSTIIPLLARAVPAADGREGQRGEAGAAASRASAAASTRSPTATSGRSAARCITRAGSSRSPSCSSLPACVVHRFVGPGSCPRSTRARSCSTTSRPAARRSPRPTARCTSPKDSDARRRRSTGTSRRTGAELGLFATEQNTGDIVARLKPEGQRDRVDLRGHRRRRARRSRRAVPRLRIEFVQILSDVINDLAGDASRSRSSCSARSSTRSRPTRRSWSRGCRRSTGLEDLFNGVSEPSAELQMHVSGRRESGRTHAGAGR